MMVKGRNGRVQGRAVPWTRLGRDLDATWTRLGRDLDATWTRLRDSNALAPPPCRVADLDHWPSSGFPFVLLIAWYTLI
jgi:hypothetical protein